MTHHDVIIVGAGAAGMMCAIEAGKRGRRVLVLDHARAPGEKIRISGGGRCNFTNLHIAPERFVSNNPRFAISALSRYQPAAFIALIERHGVAWHEKAHGQLFCDGSASQVVDLLKREMAAAGVRLQLSATVRAVQRGDGRFALTVNGAETNCESLVIASGGRSIPKMGASGFGYEIAARFGVPVIPTRPGLVPLTLTPELLARLDLAGVSVDVRAACATASFDEAMLFTHRGLSGPAILQLSSYWREGETIVIDMAPGLDLFEALRAARASQGRQGVASALALHLPKRLAAIIVQQEGAGGKLADCSDAALKRVTDAVKAWRVKPNGSEGYRTAEVTVGGVDTNALDQRTMAAKAVPGLYFVGEVVDVTGWLGGYNLQWAWASGWCAGQAV